MRLWSLHPSYLDTKGLVALWREGLLARAVLAGATRGYRHHPQLVRFNAHPDPLGAINAYLAAVLDESLRRGFRFDAAKLHPVGMVAPIAVTDGQLSWEFAHLMAKLKRRAPELWRRWRDCGPARPHPLMQVVAGPPASWEKGAG